MKKIYKYGMLGLVAALSVGMASCKPKAAQGVTATEILIGNTATEAGTWAWIGKPFNNGLRAYLEVVNTAGGIDGRTIRLINRDDGFDGAVGLTNTEALVEDDKIFALVGHFGTPTIAATVGYIKEKGIPMVYAATGENLLYALKDDLSPVMPVQPIYKTEGRIMVARVFAETAVFGSTINKVAVIHTPTGDGTGIKAGIEEQVAALGVGSKVQYFETQGGTTPDYSSTVLAALTYNPDVVIIAANQNPFKGIYAQMKVQGLNKPVITSYVNAAVAAVTAADYDATRPVYANAWVDMTSTAGATALTAFLAAINNSSLSTADKAEALSGLSIGYAIAGYIAAHVFVEGLRAVAAKTGNDKVLNWKNYIKAMEGIGAIDIPMGGTVDFSQGKRWGIDSMSLLKYVPAAGETAATFAVEKEMDDLQSILARIG